MPILDLGNFQRPTISFAGRSRVDACRATAAPVVGMFGRRPATQMPVIVGGGGGAASQLTVAVAGELVLLPLLAVIE